MAVPTLGSTPTTIDLAEAVTNWGGDTFSLEPDIKVQGSNSVACAMTASGNNDAYVTGTWDFSATGLGDQHLRLWFNITYIGNLSDTNAIQIFLYDGTNTAYYYWDKFQSYEGGWAQAIIYTGDTADSGTVTKSSVTRIGMRFVTVSKPRNVPANAWFDAWRYGDGYYATGGTSGDEITLDTIAAVDLTNAYGIVTKEVNGSISLRGDLQIGNGSTTTWFKMDNEEAFYVEEQVNTGLYKFAGNGAGCRIDIADATLKSAGTAAKDAFDFDASETNLLTFSMVDTKLTRADQVTFKSAQVATGNIFGGCGQITHAAADMDDCAVSGYEGTADTSALIYNVNADPDGEMDGMSFTKGTAATHAIEFGTTSPLTMTIRDIAFSGYTNTVASTSAPLHIKRTSGTVTINAIGCTGITADGYKTAGATVVIVIDPVTVQVTTLDETGAALGSCEVALFAAGTSTLPKINATTKWPDRAVTTFSYSGGTVTVTFAAAHGLSTGDYVWFESDNGYAAYRGVHQVTFSSTTVVTYTTAEADPSTTDPGDAAFVFLYGTSHATTGVLSMSRTFSAAQQAEGWARKSTSSPYYKQGAVSGDVSATTGLTVSARLSPDE